jgi:hypothetical protein
MAAVDAFVSEADSLSVVVKVLNLGMRGALESLGFVASADNKSVFTVVVASEEHKASVLANLRDMAVCFAGGHGWSPSDIFEYLRDRNRLSGAYRKLVWRAPGDMIVVENA